MELTDSFEASHNNFNEDILIKENRSLKIEVKALTSENANLKSVNQQKNDEIRELSYQLQELKKRNESLRSRARYPSCMKKTKKKSVRFSINNNVIHEISDVPENSKPPSLLEAVLTSQTLPQNCGKEQRGFSEAHKRALRSVLKNQLSSNQNEV